MRLVYVEDLTQKDAAEVLEISQQAVGRHLVLLETKIARVFESWARRGEGYSLSNEEEIVS